MFDEVLNDITNVNTFCTLSNSVQSKVNIYSTHDISMTEGEILKEVFKSKKVKVRPLAEKLNISRSTIHNDFNEVIIFPDRIKMYEVAVGFNWEIEKSRMSSTQSNHKLDTFLNQNTDQAVYGEMRWVDPKLSFVENVEKLIKFKEAGYFDEEALKRIISKITPKG